MQIGQRIRKIRTRQNRTLEQIARACGCTRSLLSKIETGATNPPVATLSRIAEALGVPVGSLMAEESARTTVFIPAEKLEKITPVPTDNGYAFLTLAAERTDKLMQPFLFTAKKGEVTPHDLSHRGQEYIYMLEGKMGYRVGDVTYTLEPGDSLYFDSLDAHEVIPISDEVKYLAVFTEPQS